MMEEEDYSLDQNDISDSQNESPAPSVDDLKKDPIFQKFMKKMGNCKTEQQKQALLQELQQQIGNNAPDTRTPREKLNDRLKGFKSNRMQKTKKTTNNKSCEVPSVNPIKSD